MYEVTIEVTANQNGYQAALAFEDKNGHLHERQVQKRRPESKRSNYLQGTIEALRVLENPAKVVIYSRFDELNEPIRNGWLADWAVNDWKNKKGKTVRNVEEWKQIHELMQPHQVSVVYTDERV